VALPAGVYQFPFCVLFALLGFCFYLFSVIRLSRRKMIAYSLTLEAVMFWHFWRPHHSTGSSISGIPAGMWKYWNTSKFYTEAINSHEHKLAHLEQAQ